MNSDDKQWTNAVLQTVNQEQQPLSAEERVEWAYNYFGNGLVLSTSFGIQSAVLLHLATRIYPQIPVLFIDTG